MPILTANLFAEKALGLGAKHVVIDEDIYQSDHTILVDNVLETLQALATFHRNYLKLPIIALTGSNGKTTTKELINATLSEKYKTIATVGNLNNHIGVPLTLLSMTSETEIGIVEMGANHLKEIELLSQIAQPDYGYITNFGKAHLEGFGSIEGVIKGKCELYTYLISNKKTIFINSEDVIQKEKTLNANTYSFGNKNEDNVPISFESAQQKVMVSYNGYKIQSQLIGAYNFNNIAAAITIAKFFKVDDTLIKTAIESYIPTNNRSQIVQKGNSKIILDAYNANPSSMSAALHNFNSLSDINKVCILGDMFELGKDAEKEHQTIANLCIDLDFEMVYLIGENFFNTEVASKKLKQFKSFEEFKTFFKLSPKTSVLIKGSRGMALERVLDLI